MSTVAKRTTTWIMLLLIAAATLSCAGATDQSSKNSAKPEHGENTGTQTTIGTPRKHTSQQPDPLTQMRENKGQDGASNRETTAAKGNEQRSSLPGRTTADPRGNAGKGIQGSRGIPGPNRRPSEPRTPTPSAASWRGIARTPAQREEAIRLWLGLEDREELPHPEYLEILFKTTADAIQPEHLEILKSNLTALARGGISREYLFLTCFTDYAVSDYILGDGPTTLTLARDHMGETPSYELYLRGHEAGDYGDETLRTQMEHEDLMADIVNSAEADLEQRAANGEKVVFLTPMSAHHAIAFETWQIIAEWNVQANDDGSSTATRHGTDQHDPEHQQSLANLRDRVTAAATTDAFADSRIANVSRPDPVLPRHRRLRRHHLRRRLQRNLHASHPSTRTHLRRLHSRGRKPRPRPHRRLQHAHQRQDTLAGTASLNWSRNLAITDWDGIRLGETPKRVHYLLLADEDLDGHVPAILGNLTELRRIDLDDNSLTGPLPPQLGNLKKLTHIYIVANHLSGEIPPELGSMTALQVLYLENNDLTGSLSETIGNLANLTQIVLPDNQLSGPLPASVGNLPELGHLVVRDNALTGQIPRTLSQREFTNLALSATTSPAACPPGWTPPSTTTSSGPTSTSSPAAAQPSPKKSTPSRWQGRQRQGRQWGQPRQSLGMKGKRSPTPSPPATRAVCSRSTPQQGRSPWPGRRRRATTTVTASPSKQRTNTGRKPLQQQR